MALGLVISAAHVAAATGPLTTFGEAVATSVGAGMVIGAFVAGLLGVALGWKRAEREHAVIAFGSSLGLIMVLGLANETIIG